MRPNPRQRRLLLRAMAVAAGGAVVSQVARIAVADTGPRPASAFDARRRAMVTVLADMILPATDTPGALEAGVPAFIESMVDGWYTPIERRIFLAGLDALDASARERGERRFVGAAEAVRIEVLTGAEQASLDYFKKHAPRYDPKTADEHTPFFTKLKDLTVVGFFTSEVGAPSTLHRHAQAPHGCFGDAPCAARPSST